MSLEGWIDWLALDSEELLLDKSERAELLELLLELRKFREVGQEAIRPLSEAEGEYELP